MQNYCPGKTIGLINSGAARYKMQIEIGGEKKNYAILGVSLQHAHTHAG